MKKGPNRNFVEGNLYELDLKNLPNDQVVSSFTLVTASGDPVVEQATAAPGKKRQATRTKRVPAPKPVVAVPPKVEVSTDEL